MRQIFTKQEQYKKAIINYEIRKDALEKDYTVGGVWVELEEPIRKGWFRYMVLRADIARSPVGPHLQSILDIAARTVWVRSKKKEDLYKKTYRKRRRGAEILPFFVSMTRDEYNGLTEAAKKYVSLHTDYYKRRGRRPYYVCVPTFTLEYRFKRCWITHRRVPDPEIESELAFIEHKLETYPIQRYRYKLWDKGRYWDSWYCQEAILRNKEHLAAAQEEFDELYPTVQLRIQG